MTLENVLFYGGIGIPAGMLMIGILVVFHEFGHFLVARLFGIGTPVFSVGVGHRIWGFQYNGTDFRLSALPLGGYVQLAGVDPFGEEDPEALLQPDDPRNFLNHPVHERFLVMSAGPAFNMLLAVFIFVAALMAGRPERDTVVGTVVPGTPAQELGIERGDELVALNGYPIKAWRDWERMAKELPHSEATLTVARDGAEQTLGVPAGAIPLTFDGALDSEKFGLSHLVESARIGVDDPQSPAALAGLKTGDMVVSVDGAEVLSWPAILDALGDGGTHTVEVSRASDDPEIEPSTHTVTIAATEWRGREGDTLVSPVWGIVPVQVYISSVIEDSPAEAAGLEAGDRLFAVNGEPIRSWAEITWLVGATVTGQGESATPQELRLSVVRDGQVQHHAFTPRLQRELVRGEPHFRPIMGVYRYGASFAAGGQQTRYYGPIEAMPVAMDLTTETVRKIFRVLGHLVVWDLEFKEAMGGPVAIVHMAAQSASMGFWPWVHTLAMISISLAIMNLLPVPVLDGGHILFYFLEMVRGRPLPLAIRERVQMMGGLFLAAVMVVAFVNDIGRLFDGPHGP